MSHAIVDSALPTRHYIYLSLSLFQFNLSVLVSFYSYRLTWRNKVDSRNSTCARLFEKQFRALILSLDGPWASSPRDKGKSGKSRDDLLNTGRTRRHTHRCHFVSGELSAPFRPFVLLISHRTIGLGRVC